MLHIFHGADSWSRNEALAELRRSLDTDGMLSTNTTVFDARSLRPEQLLAACDTVPFLASCRLVEVEGLLAAAAPEGRRRAARPKRAVPTSGESTWSRLVEYAPRLPETTQLVLIEQELRETNWLFAALRPLATIHAFAPLSADALRSWIEARVRTRRGAIVPRAAAALAESVGANLWQLAHEVEKLTLYAHDRPIEVADVRLLVHGKESGTVFQLVDAVVARQGGEALRLARLLIDGGAAGPYLLTMIVRQFRQLLLLRDMQGGGVSRPEMARRLEIRSDFVLGRLLEQARRVPPGRLEQGYERLLVADLNTKRGIQDEETAIELLVAEIAGLR